MKDTDSLDANSDLSRRAAVKRLATGALALSTVAGALNAAADEPKPAELYKVRHGRIQQSVIHWCFDPMTPPELAGHAADLGMASVELVAPEHWPELTRRGLVCAISPSHGFNKGFAHPSEHDECIQTLRRSIDNTSAAGFKNVITFSGFRRGLTTEDATKNMVEGLKKIAGYAEQKNVTLCLEMLNSRVNITMKGHPDYFCDDIDHAVEICRQVGSERVKLLFDIYHVQIMHGDLIARIRKYHPYIAHYHTAGNPGRNEIDDSQEINYAGVMKAILETGYKGFVGQEFIPTRDKVAS
ncbi:MAG TPA: TIM barrel protein, partial [Candidatus Cybelea sp.]|nr:TIM barrel protein [Candidatus Cybelea sp.]